MRENELLREIYTNVSMTPKANDTQTLSTSCHCTSFNEHIHSLTMHSIIKIHLLVIQAHLNKEK